MMLCDHPGAEGCHSPPVPFCHGRVTLAAEGCTHHALRASVLLNSINVNFVNALHFYYGVSQWEWWEGGA